MLSKNNPKSNNSIVQATRDGDKGLRSGIPASWFVLGDACEAIEAKFAIGTPDENVGNEGFGDLITYCRMQLDAIRQRNIIRKDHGHRELAVPEQLRGMLVDRVYFWLLEVCSISGWPSSLSWGKFTDGGSAAAIASFFPPLPWHIAVRDSFLALGVDDEKNFDVFLGEGAMARVFSAKLNLHRVAVKVVALKMLSPAQQSCVVDQLERDYELLKSLQGRGLPIVQVVSDFCRGENFACFAMTPIADHVVCLTDLKARGLYLACESLRKLHCNQVVHGDPRLDNLLVLSSGEFVWTDLAQGYAKRGIYGQIQDIVIFSLSCLRLCKPDQQALNDEFVSALNTHDGSDESWKIGGESIRVELGLV